jgi:hypothetical protein
MTRRVFLLLSLVKLEVAMIDRCLAVLLIGHKLLIRPKRIAPLERQTVLPTPSPAKPDLVDRYNWPLIGPIIGLTSCQCHTYTAAMHKHALSCYQMREESGGWLWGLL